MRIEKLAAASRFHRPMFRFPSARSAFSAFLLATEIKAADLVLLPSYIGWSAREGSGVFDPVVEAGCRYSFYPLSERLIIDVTATKELIRMLKPRVFVLVHYFGFPDPNAPELAAYASSMGAMVLEDEAHAMLSDLVGGICGRSGTAAIFSLHKLLPVSDGGVLVLNHPDKLKRSSGWEMGDGLLSDYDLFGIALRRRQNADEMLDRIGAVRSWMQPLYGKIPSGVVPQTLPVVIRERNRDELYFKLNEAGYGVVSLYHTLISAVDKNQFQASHCLSRAIMNLPVHQDVELSAIRDFVEVLKGLDGSKC